MKRRNYRIDIVTFIDKFCKSRSINLVTLCSRLRYDFKDFIRVFDDMDSSDFKRLYENITGVFETTDSEFEEFGRLYFEIKLSELSTKAIMSEAINRLNIFREELAERLNISLNTLELFLEERLDRESTIMILAKMSNFDDLSGEIRNKFLNMLKEVI